MQNQKTISSLVTFKGEGLHTGCSSTITIKPATANNGIVFIRTDMPNSQPIKAVVENVAETARGTTICQNGIKVYTTEHLLSALTGLGIDNVIIEIDAEEVPILNGSSHTFCQSILAAGITELAEKRDYYEIKEIINYSSPDGNTEYIVLPHHELDIDVLIDYNSDALPNQYAHYCDSQDYISEIAPARTFVFHHEIENLIKNNLIKGGDLSNAMVIVEKDISISELNTIAEKMNKPPINEVPINYILSNEPIKFPNEPARHKLLDLIGDLALVGQPLKAKIIAKKPGHKHNVELGKLIRQQIKKEKSKKAVPSFNIYVEPLMDINRIKQILPHRYPFLLVDKILELNDEYVIGLKNITGNEEFFIGHFPDEPVMPGVLIVEAMAQVGGIFVLDSVPDPENYATYFMKIDNVRFKKKVVPGDTIVFKLEMTQPVRRGIAMMRGWAYVGENVVMEGELMAQIAKKEIK